MKNRKYDERKAREILRELGIQSYYKGFRITLLALDVIAENEDCLTATCKEIYLPISEKMNCNYATVESSIRRILEKAWETNPNMLCGIVDQKLENRPQARQFLGGLYYVCREGTDDDLEKAHPHEEYSIEP